jgi:hypothetical protein
MPAGDLVTVDFQWELRTALMGAGTNVRAHRRKGGIVGLLDAPGGAAESEYAHADGAFIGEVRRPPRTATFNLVIDDVSPAVAGALLAQQEAVWAATGVAEEPLHFQLPGYGKRYVNGWPLGTLDVDTTDLVFGVVTFAALFRITNPTIFTP